MHRLLIAALLALAFLAAPSASAATAEGEEIDGGPAATRATPVEPGTTYVDDVQAGEARWYSVPVGAGQAFGVTLTEYGDVEYRCCLKVSLADTDFNSKASDNSYNSDGTAETLRVATDEDGVEEAGTYYVQVQLDQDAAVRPVTFEFTVDVTGEAIGEDPAASPSASPSAEKSPETEDDTEDDTEPASTDTDDGGGGFLLWLIVGLLALLVLLLLGTVVLLLVRMQRQQTPTTHE
jgi:hypothetical protein